MITRPNLALAGLVALSAAAAPALAQSDAAGSAPHQGAPSQPEPMFANADELLDALETADEGLQTLQSRLSYIRVKSHASVVETRTGNLYFESEPAPNGARPQRRFAMDFKQTIIGNVRHTDRSVLLFDGRRLYDKEYAAKLMIVRPVVDPNDPNAEARDPMRLGEGPLPIPIGQKKSDILAAYRAELVSDLTAGLETPEDPLDTEVKMYPSLRSQVTGGDGSKAARTVQLHLEARDQDAEFLEIRLWYRRGVDSREPREARDGDAEGRADARLLPFIARAVGRDGDVSIFQLTAVRVNEPLIDEAAEVMSPKAPEGWTTETRDFF